MEFKSKARVLDSSIVEVEAIDGEKFNLIRGIGSYTSEETRNFELHLIEYIFDENFSEDKEIMVNKIWHASFTHGIAFMGMSSGDRHNERIRIGNAIRQIREERNMEARHLAMLSGIDPANLCRIENGKYSVGLDILSKIAAALGKKIDFVDL